MYFVVILFTDMAGWTKYCQCHSPEEARAKRKRCEELLRSAIAVHRGEVLEVQGDSLMVRFERAIDAARCAIAMQRRIAESNRAGGIAGTDEEIHIRVGFHWGQALESRAEGSVELDGPVKNVAKRVEESGQRQTDQILLSEAAVAELIPHLDELALEEHGVVDARGIGSLRVYRLHWQDGERPKKTVDAAAAAEIRSRVAEWGRTRSIHCLCVDRERGAVSVHPLYVRVDPNGSGRVRSRVESSRETDAAAERAVLAAFAVLQRLGFPEARFETHNIEWRLEGARATCAGPAIGLGAALAAAAAYTGVVIDTSLAASGATDGERVVATGAETWRGSWDAQFRTLVASSEDAASLAAVFGGSSAPQFLAVSTVEDAFVEVLGAELGLTRRESARIELRLERDRGAPLLGAAGPGAEVWHVGDRIRVFVRATRDSFLSLVSIDSTGKVRVLAPNELTRVVRLQADRWQAFPGDDAGFTLRVLGPAGRSEIIAIASAEPLAMRPEDIQPRAGSAGISVRGAVIPLLKPALQQQVLGTASFTFQVVEGAAGDSAGRPSD
jgi:class 3 adenylate cyclase